LFIAIANRLEFEFLAKFHLLLCGIFPTCVLNHPMAIGLKKFHINNLEDELKN
jgi:hypothetical protein